MVIRIKYTLAHSSIPDGLQGAKSGNEPLYATSVLQQSQLKGGDKPCHHMTDYLHP